ncbi:MAG: hypothetical protein R3Y47_09355 [Lachnospiraceae bacterium]
MKRNVLTAFLASIMVLCATGILIGSMYWYESVTFEQEWQFQPTSIEDNLE